MRSRFEKHETVALSAKEAYLICLDQSWFIIQKNNLTFVMLSNLGEFKQKCHQESYIHTIIIKFNYIIINLITYQFQYNLFYNFNIKKLLELMKCIFLDINLKNQNSDDKFNILHTIFKYQLIIYL